MRARLMEATVELLVERGFSGTSTTLVSERAGVSRGAQLHHFPTKNDLVLAAVEHLTELRGAGSRPRPSCPRARAAPGRPADARRPLHLTGVHRCAGALGRRPHRRDTAGRGRAAGAARRPRDAPAHRRAARRRRVAGPASASWCRRRSTWCAASAWPNTITDDTRRRGRILDQWARTLDAPWRRRMSDLDEAARRPRRRGRPAPGDGGRPGRGRLAHGRRPRTAGPSPPRSPTCSGPTRSRCWRAHRGTRQGRVGRGGAGGDRRPAWATSTRPPTSSPRSPGRAAGPVGRRPDRARQALREVPTGQKMPWFGPPMSPASMATARFMETWAHALDVYDAAAQGGSVPSRPTGSSTWPTSGSAPATTRSPAARAAAGRGVPGRADRARRRVWTWGRRTPRRRGHRLGVRLLPARHPAHPPRRHRSGCRRRRRGALARHRPGVRRAGGRGPGRLVTTPSYRRQLLRLLRRPVHRDARVCSRGGGRWTCSPVTTLPS